MVAAGASATPSPDTTKAVPVRDPNFDANEGHVARAFRRRRESLERAKSAAEVAAKEAANGDGIAAPAEHEPSIEAARHSTATLRSTFAASVVLATSGKVNSWLGSILPSRLLNFASSTSNNLQLL